MLFVCIMLIYFLPLTFANAFCSDTLSLVYRHTMDSLSDFELLIRVFLVLICRCVSAGIATGKFIIL